MSVRAGHDWTAYVRVGTLQWTIDKGDPAAFGPMAPLSVGWKFPDDGLWPTAPEPLNLQLSLVMPDAASVDQIDIGTSVYVLVYLGITDGTDPLPSVVFTGQVAQLNGHPVRANGTDAWQLDLSCTDYVAGLGEREVAGYIPFQGVGVQTWVEKLFANAGMNPPDWNGGGWGQAMLTLNDGRIEPGSVLERVDSILSTYADGGNIIGAEDIAANHEWYPYEGWRRGYLQPVTFATTGNLSSWRVYWFSKRNTVAASSYADVYPMSMAYSGGLAKWSLFRSSGLAGLGGSDWIDATQVISADYIDFAADWKRTKNTSPTNVSIANNTPADEYVLDPWDQVNKETGERTRGPITTRVTDFLGYQKFNAEWSAEMLLPDVVPYKSTPNGFSWYASADPDAPVLPSWFPGVHTLWLGHSIPLVIDNLPQSQTPAVTPGDPANPAWYAGTLSGATFVIEPGGTYRFDFTMRPGAPEPGGLDIAGLPNGYLRPADAGVGGPAHTATWTPANTDPKLTPHHLRLARRTQ